MKIEKTGYNYRTRKERTIMAFVYDANGTLLDAIHPGGGNHRTALDWATWRANTIREDYPAAATMAIHCGDDEIAVITLDNNNPDNTTPETSDTMNTETTPANNQAANVADFIADKLTARKDRSAWNKAVTAYALELVESLDGWDKQPASVAELREMMLNGADNWGAYSWGGCSLIYNQDVAERVCSPSELKRVTRKDGSLRDMANAREHWLDVQARALYQAANRVANIAAKYFNA